MFFSTRHAERVGGLNRTRLGGVDRGRWAYRAVVHRTRLRMARQEPQVPALHVHRPREKRSMIGAKSGHRHQMRSAPRGTDALSRVQHRRAVVLLL